MEKLTNLSKLSVGNEKRTQGLQTLDSVVTVLLGTILVNRCIRPLRLNIAQTLSLPDELLEQVTIVLAENQLASLVNDHTEVPDQLLTFFREVLGGGREGLGLKGAVQSDVALLVRGQLAMLEACVENPGQLLR